MKTIKIIALVTGGTSGIGKEIDQKLKETPLGRFATPENIAKLCLFLFSDDFSFITGENIWINGGRK